MNKYQKELIDKCEPYKEGTPFDNLYVIPSGKAYNGFWGKNGYNNILLVCHDYKEDKWYLAGEPYQADVLYFGEIIAKRPRPILQLDIPNKINCVRIYSVSRKRLCFRETLSTMTLEDYE